MRREYPHPPIIEVMSSFHFQVKNPADLTVLGRFYEKIQEDFPHKEEIITYEAGIEFKREEKDLSQKIRMKLFGMEFKSDDKKEVIRVAPDFLSVHHLVPYPGFENFLKLVERALNIFKDIIQPECLKFANLRYIDRIEIPKRSFELSEYFLIYPQVPKEQNISNFFLHIEIPFNSRDTLVVMMYIHPQSPQDKTWIIMDWDYRLIKPVEVFLDKICEWLKEGHNNIIKVFEKSLTDACRELFK